MRDQGPISLQNPDEFALENAYRSLPRVGEITLETSLSKLSFQLDSLEQAGFAGMEIKVFASAEDKISIRAFKGKQGSCFDTGRFARYQGTALAAMDDDYHLLLAGEDIRVCEKTATFYSLPVYRNHIHCSEADAGLTEKIRTDPVLFEGDNFELAQEKLFASVREAEPGGAYTDLFYPGPFKLLVLEDGTLVHRGRINKVPVEAAKNLKKRDGLFDFDKQADGRKESFIELYKSEGARCLLRKSQHYVITEHEHVSDLSALNNISRELRGKMIQTIEKKKDYFILTGSNREDEYGCCPSDEVTLADNLVRHGILSDSREPATAEACPLTIYAFRNEISSIDGHLKFNQDQHFRDEVSKRLQQGNLRLLKLLTRLVLLVFIAVTIALALIRISRPSAPLQETELYSRLEVSRPNSTLLVLFHYRQRCEQCLAMEQYSREVLEDDFSGMIQKKQLQFRQVAMDLPENRSLIDRFELLTSSLVIIRFDDMQADSIRVLNRSWELSNKETEFKKMLREDLHQMIGQENE